MDSVFLRDLLSTPTAPFREKLVLQKLSAYLQKNRLPFFVDPIGNVVVGPPDAKTYRRWISEHTEYPLPIFIAHTDHPGFHGVRARSDKILEFEWFGGAPTRLLKGARVWLADDKGYCGAGRIKTVRLTASKRTIASGTLEILKTPDSRQVSDPKRLFGGFGFRAPVFERGRLIYTKAADDLVGAFAIAMLAKRFTRRSDPKRRFVGIFTRAEEVGFIGCIGHFKSGFFQKARRPIVAVSLETSRQLPGAHIGKGPVLRLGDRFGVFDPRALHAFETLARGKKLSFQKRIMDGGTCEATVATVWGMPAIGISVPLGNYHNQSFEGGPDSRGNLGPAPEFVHKDDIRGLLDLAQILVTDFTRQPLANTWNAEQKRLGALYQTYARRFF